MRHLYVSDIQRDIHSANFICELFGSQEDNTIRSLVQKFQRRGRPIAAHHVEGGILTEGSEGALDGLLVVAVVGVEKRDEFLVAFLVLIMLGSTVFYGGRITKRMNADAEALVDRQRVRELPYFRNKQTIVQRS